MSQSTTSRPAVVITGASTGIGYASALALEERGFRVFAGVRSPADEERIQSLGRPGLLPLRLDVTEEESIAAAVSTLQRTLGDAGLRGLVNNAGIVVAGPMELLPLAAIRKQFEVNVLGHLAVTQAMMPLLRQGHGRIINMGSLNGRIAAPYLGPYAASKHAMEAFSDALRSELRTWGIYVSLIQPCSIDTPIWDKSFAAADGLTAETAPERLALYDEDLTALREATKKLAARALPVAKVVRAVVRAMTARRPKPRYRVGLETRLAFLVYPVVPDRLWDWIIRKQLGLKG